MSKLISIIVPNYNHYIYLQQRLESIFNQTYQNFEVIILDDCSDDASVQLLKTYANHSKVSHLIINKQNSGSPFKQWQKGIELAKGDYIWIAESDDHCDFTFLENLVQFLTPEIVLAYCGSLTIDSASKVLGVNEWAVPLNAFKWSEDYVNNGKEEIRNYLRYRNVMPNASAVLFKKSACLEIKIPVNMFFCGDWYTWIALLKLGNVAYSKKSLNFYRKHQDSTTKLKDIKLEHKRFYEYSLIIENNSTFFERIFNRNKYLWIVEEWIHKSRYFRFKDVVKIKMPIDLYTIFLFRYLLFKTKKLKFYS